MKPSDSNTSGRLPQNFEEFYEQLLRTLRKHDVIYTKSREAPNRLTIQNNTIMVATNKSAERFEEIPIDFIRTAYEELRVNGRVSQPHLSKELYVKRSAFIFAAFDLLDHIAYDPKTNSLIIR